MGDERAVEYALSEQECAPHTIATPEEPSAGGRPDALTRRQREVAALVARGMTNRRLAEELSISEHTAATHVRKILRKLNLASRAQLAALATEQRLQQQTYRRS